jgi:hypothetical protein
MIRHVCISLVCTVLFLPLSIVVQNVGVAQVMQSGQYQIQSDSINIGGVLSESSEYRLEDTVGEQGTGISSSSSFILRAGYQQMQGVQLAMSPIDSVPLSPSIPGVAGGFANGSTSVVVITDSPAGYELLIKSDSTPALQTAGGSSTIADYVPVGVADYDLDTGDSDAHFGYSIEGENAVNRFWHDGVDKCGGAGSFNTAQVCWDGLSTTSKQIVLRTTSNHPSGTETRFHFRVGVGGSVIQAPGVYTATTTVTALPL